MSKVGILKVIKLSNRDFILSLTSSEIPNVDLGSLHRENLYYKTKEGLKLLENHLFAAALF